MHIPDIKIAVDGYSSTGKSSFARLIAKEFSFLYLDSGALYRAVTLFAIRNGMTGEGGSVDAGALSASLPEIRITFRNDRDGSHTFLGDECVDEAIRTIEVSSYVSPVAVIPEVREFVDRILRDYGKAGRVVMDGRDIGTTVFPDAELKIFMVADAVPVPHILVYLVFDGVYSVKVYKYGYGPSGNFPASYADIYAFG